MRTINYEVNEFQTPITEDLLSEYPDEVVEWFWDAINSIDAIRWLIDPKRPRAKDLPRDNKGRIIVDIAHPHIIEDADYFRQPALHYMKHGCYTFLKPSKNPHSEYRKYWDEEVRRCREGYVRGIKEGDLVCINPSRFAEKQYQDGSLKDGIVTQNKVIRYNFDTVEMDDKVCLLLQDRDISFVISEYEEIEEPEKAKIIVPQTNLIL